MKTKREYVRPVMKVVELRQTAMLMVSNGQQAASAGMSVTYEEEEI